MPSVPHTVTITGFSQLYCESVKDGVAVGAVIIICGSDGLIMYYMCGIQVTLGEIEIREGGVIVKFITLVPKVL